MTEGSVGYDALNNVNNGAEGWGQISSRMCFAIPELSGPRPGGTDCGVVAIPEPSTYALMGLGLVGIAVVARKR